MIWSESDRMTLRCLSPRDAARRLGRSLQNIYSARRRFGVAAPHGRVTESGLRKLHALGWSDHHIARDLLANPAR